MRYLAILALLALAAMLCPAQDMSSEWEPEWSFTFETDEDYTRYPGGFDEAPAGQLLIGAIPSDDELSDGRGLTISTFPGEVELLLFPSLKVGNNLVTIRVSVQAAGAGATIALAALDGSMDGSIGTNVPGNSSAFQNNYRRLTLTYDPPGDSVIPAFQVANGGKQPVSIYLDNLEVLVIPRDVQVPSNLLYGESITPTVQPTATPTGTPAIQYGEVLIEEDDFGKTYSVSQGDRFSIILDEGLSTGYIWAIEEMDERIVLFEQAVFAFKEDNDPSSGATRTFTFLAKSPGTTQIELVYRQSWNTVPVNRFTVTIIVEGRTPTPSPSPTSTPTPYVDEEDRVITIPLAGLPGDAKPLEMVLLNSGTFWMGSLRDSDFRRSNEWPRHQVTITKHFYIGRYEVTQGQWEAVMGANPSTFSGKGPDVPVENVSWNDCRRFIERLNNLGLGVFRLPTEAEWEYACRAGTDTHFYWGDDPDDVAVSDYAWYSENSVNSPHEVGLKTPNAWGLYDMSGNVYEWCRDWFGAYAKEAEKQTDPTGPEYGTSRVNRGGCWNLGAWNCRSAHRVGYQPHFKYSFLGFRIVREWSGKITPTPSPTARPTPTPTPTPISPDYFLPTPTPTPNPFTPGFSQLKTVFGTGTDFTQTLALADVDRDGDLDLAVGNIGQSQGGQNRIYLNDPVGQFEESVPFGTGSDRTYSIAFGDVDNDDDPDLAVGNDWQTGNAVYLNDEGVLTRLVSVGPGTDDTWAVALSDVDGDNDLDFIACTKQCSKQAKPSAVYLNGGFGSFTQGIQFGDESLNALCLALGDMDGDGDNDLAIGREGQNVVFLNDGTGRFNTSVPFGTGGDKTYSLASGDVDRDGDLDLAVGNYGQKNAVYLNDGMGHFEAVRYVGEHSGRTTCVKLCDIDGDLDLDIVVANYGEQNRVLFNNGAGEFTPGLYFGTGTDKSVCLGCGDLDGDFDPDIAVGNEGEPNVVYFNTGR